MANCTQNLLLPCNFRDETLYTTGRTLDIEIESLLNNWHLSLTAQFQAFELFVIIAIISLCLLLLFFILLWTPVCVKGFVRILQERVSVLDYDREVVSKKDEDKLVLKPKSVAGGAATVILAILVLFVVRFVVWISSLILLSLMSLTFPQFQRGRYNCRTKWSGFYFHLFFWWSFFHETRYHFTTDTWTSSKSLSQVNFIFDIF